MSLYRSAGWSALPRTGLSLPQSHLRLPGHQSARLGLRPAPARALGGDGPVQERHGRPGQERHPQLQSQGHRQQDGEKNFSSFFRITRLKCQCGTYILFYFHFIIYQPQNTKQSYYCKTGARSFQA